MGRVRFSASLIEALIYDRPAEWDEDEGGRYTKLVYKHKSVCRDECRELGRC